jgi:hypothetical protein
MLSNKNNSLEEEFNMSQNNNNNTLVPDAKNGLEKFKSEVASEMGVPFTEYNGNLSSKQCGSVGGEMVKRMVKQYENGLK